jgi:TPR repeat protein
VNWSRIATIGFVGLVLVAAGAYFGLQRLQREGRAVDDGVVEFKKGNYESAVRMLTPYADKGNKAAELNVGLAYAFGLGVARNRERAHTLFRDSLGKKSPDTCLWVAKSFEAGDGVGKDAAEALAWYHIAAADGSREAAEHLTAIGPGS